MWEAFFGAIALYFIIWAGACLWIGRRNGYREG